jgi:hypothetical protein
MHIRKAVLSLAVLGLGLAPFSFGQLASQDRPSHPILGYYDAATGAFTAVQTESQEAVASAVTPTTGTFIFKFTLTVKSAVPKNSVIVCKGIALLNGDSSGYTTQENATGIATRVSGNTYSCTATVNYSWPITSASTDKIYLQADVSINYSLQVTASNGTSVTDVLITTRAAHPNFAPPIGVPLNGATTTETFNLTL